MESSAKSRITGAAQPENAAASAASDSGQSASDARSKPVAIKKYANRRLYNTATSGYVTLDGLSQMIKEGVDFEVFDAKTGENITRSVLTQIIVEEEAKGENLLPTNFLRQIIALYGDGLDGAVTSYLDKSMELFAHNQEVMRDFLSRSMETGRGSDNPIEAITRQNMALFQNAMTLFNPAAYLSAAQGVASQKTPAAPVPPAGAAAPVPPSGNTAPPSTAEDLHALKAQMDAIQAQLSKLSSGGG